MGQYYLAIILGEKQPDGDNEIIRMALESYAYNNGAKLREHSYVGNEYVSAVEYLISPEGMFYKSRLVWAGDYADNEKSLPHNLYHVIDEIDPHKLQVMPVGDVSKYRFIVNHTKKQYAEKITHYHPLPLLTCEGNGRGGGDYTGQNKELCGSWARDVLSVEVNPPNDYAEIKCGFQDLD